MCGGRGEGGVHALVTYPKTHRKTDLHPASNQKQTRGKEGPGTWLTSTLSTETCSGKH